MNKRLSFAVRVVGTCAFAVSTLAQPPSSLWRLIPSVALQRQGAATTAKYLVKLMQLTPPKLSVSATLPINGNALKMETTRPGDIPQVLKEGWPALIRNLRISDGSGRPIEVASTGKAGWELKQTHTGWLTLNYEVDYSMAESLNWPAPREAAFKDSAHFVFAGRSAFITTSDITSSVVTFSLPHPWRADVPWNPTGGLDNTFAVEVPKDLTTNLIVFTATVPNEVTAGNFHVFFTPMGPWMQASPEVKRVLQAVVPRFVSLMHFQGHGRYSVVLLPLQEDAGEAYRNSFALTNEQQPSSSNLPSWGHAIAHEIFHYWNGLRLRGSDYASSQWFQEGFTDYAADLAMVNSGLVSPDSFRQKLGQHIRNYRRLTTALNAPGDQKGPPLYGGGALVAFCWDVQIRHATGGKRSIVDFLRALWRQTNGGQREYAWKDIQAALDSTASLDWNAFFQNYISGTEKLPLAKVFKQAGLKIAESTDGPLVQQDHSASAKARALWRALVQGRLGFQLGDDAGGTTA